MVLIRYASLVRESESTISAPCFRTLAIDVVSGLLHLTKHRVLHLDIKLDNILVRVYGGMYAWANKTSMRRRPLNKIQRV